MSDESHKERCDFVHPLQPRARCAEFPTPAKVKENPVDDLMSMPCLYISGEQHKKIAADEPVFVLRAQDVTAPAAIEAWCALATEVGSSPEKIAHARLHAEAMRRWAGAKKVPD